MKKDKRPVGALRTLDEVDAAIKGHKSIFMIWERSEGLAFIKNTLDDKTFRDNGIVRNAASCHSYTPEIWSSRNFSPLSSDFHVDSMNLEDITGVPLGYLFTNYFHAFAYWCKRKKELASAAE